MDVTLTWKKQFIVWVGALFVSSIITGVVGYQIRDFFDKPRIKIERIKYRVSRVQCVLTAETFYRFISARGLRENIDKVVNWKTAEDLEDGALEYDHIEDLLRQFPVRKDALENEIKFITDRIALIERFQKDIYKGKAVGNIRELINYLFGLNPTTQLSEMLGISSTMLSNLHAEFEKNPKETSKLLKNSLSIRKKLLEQEGETIDLIIGEIKPFHSKGQPSVLPFVGTDFANLPSVGFAITIANYGRTQGQISYASEFHFQGNEPYKVTLTGMNPKTKYLYSPHYFSKIKPYDVDEYWFGIDKLKNQIRDIQLFYSDLHSKKGLSGTFHFTDINGELYKYQVENMKPYN